jgi:hypothetical protein
LSLNILAQEIHAASDDASRAYAKSISFHDCIKSICALSGKLTPSQEVYFLKIKKSAKALKLNWLNDLLQNSFPHSDGLANKTVPNEIENVEAITPVSLNKVAQTRILAISTKQELVTAEECRFLFETLNSNDFILALQAAGEIGLLPLRGVTFRAPEKADLIDLYISAVKRHQANHSFNELMSRFFEQLSANESDKIFHAFAHSEDSTGLVNACQFVKALKRNDLLDFVKPLLNHSNTWVKRSAEEAFEGLKLKTWRGQVFGQLSQAEMDNEEGPEWEIRQLPVSANFQAKFDAVVSILISGDKDKLSAAISALSEDDSRSGLWAVLVDSQTPIERKQIALSALVSNGGPLAIDAILSFAGRCNDAKTLAAIASSLPELKKDDAAPVLLTSILSGLDARLDGACAKTIAHLPSAKPTKLILDKYKETEFIEVRELLAQVLAEVAVPEAIPLLKANLTPWPEPNDQFADFARATLTALISIGTVQSIEPMFDIQMSDEVAKNPKRSALVTEAIQMSIAYYHDKTDIVNLAVNKLKSESPVIRAVAGSALAGIRGNLFVEQSLKDALKVEGDESIKKVLQEALAGTGNKKPKSIKPPPYPSEF